MQLSNNVFLIVGGSSGLGAACTREFAEAGARVVVADIQQPAQDQAARPRATGDGGTADSAQLDVSPSAAFPVTRSAASDNPKRAGRPSTQGKAGFLRRPSAASRGSSLAKCCRESGEPM